MDFSKYLYRLAITVLIITLQLVIGNPSQAPTPGAYDVSIATYAGDEDRFSVAAREGFPIPTPLYANFFYFLDN